MTCILWMMCFVVCLHFPSFTSHLLETLYHVLMTVIHNSGGWCIVFTGGFPAAILVWFVSSELVLSFMYLTQGHMPLGLVLNLFYSQRQPWISSFPASTSRVLRVQLHTTTSSMCCWGEHEDSSHSSLALDQPSKLCPQPICLVTEFYQLALFVLVFFFLSFFFNFLLLW